MKARYIFFILMTACCALVEASPGLTFHIPALYLAILLASIGLLIPVPKLGFLYQVLLVLSALKIDRLSYYGPILFTSAFSLSPATYLLFNFAVSLSMAKPHSLLLILLSLIQALVLHHLKTLEDAQKDRTQEIDRIKAGLRKLTLQNEELLRNHGESAHIAILQERNRIAREMHDHAGHNLSSAIIQTGAIRMMEKDPDQVHRLVQLEDTLQKAMTGMRSSVHDLYDQSLDLDALIQSRIQAFSFCPIRYDNHIHFSLSRELTYAIVAIITEALTNVQKHSNATEVRITLQNIGDRVQVLISDNGSQQGLPSDGIGILNMRARTEHLGGDFHISTENGYYIFANFPKGGEP